MIISTRDFGNVEISSEDIIQFTQPIYGFENLNEFAILFNEEISDHFVWLQSLQDEGVCFTLANPEIVVRQYSPQLTDDVKKQLANEEYMFWLVVVMSTNLSECTVNLKSPIVVCPSTKIGMQVILDENLPIRYPLLGQRKENERC
ncbi:MAG: flagellar assembly protein FliW [Angelakisella sp.]|nr:flagellar assembly protein FliW [Angelakisella sp.]